MIDQGLHALGDEGAPQRLLRAAPLNAAVQQLWAGEHHGQQPDAHAGELADEKDAGTVAVGRDGLDDGDVAVDADAEKQEHAAEEANLVDAKDELANVDPEDPGLGRAVRPEGKGQEEEDVRHGQVEQVGIGHGLEPLEIDVGQHDQPVAQQAHEANDGVHDREEPGFKVPHVLLEAHGLVQRVVHCGVVSDVIVCDLILAQAHLWGRNTLQLS